MSTWSYRVAACRRTDRGWIACRPRYFLTVEVLSALFRRLLLQMLVAAHDAGRLQFFGEHARLADKAAFKAYLAPLREIDWVVYAKEPFAGPRQVLRYLSRYTHRIAISNRRLVAADHKGVTFKYKDYRIEGLARYKTMTLATDEFIRRFLIHVLPKGFHRIRHYGLLATGDRAANIAHARELLAVPSRPKNQRRPKHAIRRAARAAASMPVLRRPHDRHRDLRARLRAEAPPHTGTGGDQDRHLMRPSPPIDDRNDHRHSRRLSAGSAHARIAPPDSPAVARPILSRDAQNARSYRTHIPRVAKPDHRNPPLQFSQARARGKIPIAPAAPSCPTSRDFVPWRFSDAGRHSPWMTSSCRRPKTCTRQTHARSKRSVSAWRNVC